MNLPLPPRDGGWVRDVTLPCLFGLLAWGMLCRVICVCLQQQQQEEEVVVVVEVLPHCVEVHTYLPPYMQQWAAGLGVGMVGGKSGC